MSPLGVTVAETFRPSLMGKKPEELYGTVSDLDDYFDEHPLRPTPFPRQHRSKVVHDYDRVAVRKVLSAPPVLDDVDPRLLRSSQPSVTRSGIKHYMSDDHKRTGLTYADQGNIGNTHPVVYVHDNGDHVILSGHHRATKALFAGQPLRVRLVRGGRPPR